MIGAGWTDDEETGELSVEFFFDRHDHNQIEMALNHVQLAHACSRPRSDLEIDLAMLAAALEARVRGLRARLPSERREARPATWPVPGDQPDAPPRGDGG